MDRSRRGLLKAVACSPAVAAIPVIAAAKSEDAKLVALKELLAWDLMDLGSHSPAVLPDLLRSYRAVMLGLIEAIEERDGDRIA